MKCRPWPTEILCPSEREEFGRGIHPRAGPNSRHLLLEKNAAIRTHPPSRDSSTVGAKTAHCGNESTRGRDCKVGAQRATSKLRHASETHGLASVPALIGGCPCSPFQSSKRPARGQGMLAMLLSKTRIPPRWVSRGITITNSGFESGKSLRIKASARSSAG